MKKLLSIFLALWSLTAGAQVIVKRSSPYIQAQDARVQGTLNFICSVYPDTATANTYIGLDSLGAIIQIRATGEMYHRDTTAGGHRWTLIGQYIVNSSPVTTSLSIITTDIYGRVLYSAPATSSNIIVTLGYTPYDAANPNNYISLADLPNTFLRNGLHARDSNTLVVGTTPGNLIDTSTVFDFNNHFFGFKGVPIQTSVPSDYYLIIEDTTNHTLKHIKPSDLGITGAANPFADNTDIIKNAADATKILRFSAASITTGTTRTWTFPDVNGTVARNDAAQTFTGIQTFSSSPVIPTASPGDNSTKGASTAYTDAGLALKANLASPALTGTPTAPTASPGNNSTQIATTAYTDAGSALKANLASPTFTGTPVLPTGTTGVTQSPGDNSTKLATTAYVNNNEFWLVQPTAVSGASNIIVDFSSVYNTFSRVEIYLYGLVPASDNKELQMQLSSDGVTYNNSGYAFASMGLVSSSSTNANNVSASQTYMSLGTSYGNAAAKSNHCIVKLFANGVSSRNVTYGYEAHYITSAGSTAIILGSMSLASASVQKFVKIFYPSANISCDSYSVKVFK